MPRPTPTFTDNIDHVESGQDISELMPRNRRRRLQQALQSTSELAREVSSRLPSLRQVTSQPWSGQRRRRSPSTHSGRSQAPNDTAHDEEDRPSRSKRRKFDSIHHPRPSKPAIRYGHFGQVEAGRLKLELISCDGGEYVDPHHPSVSLAAANVLVHDKSVYSSIRSDSNIILGHADETFFCLEKIHIIGPEHGFAAPVCRGTVHVAMTMRSLQRFLTPPVYARRSSTNPCSRLSPYNRGSGASRSPERLSLSEALYDEEIARELRRHRNTSSRRGEELSGHSLQAATHSIGDPMEFGEESTGDESDGVLPWTISADDDPGAEVPTSAQVEGFRTQRLRSMRRRFDHRIGVSDSERDNDWSGFSTLGSTDISHDRTRTHAPYSTRLDAFISQRGRPDRQRMSPTTHSPQIDPSDMNTTTLNPLTDPEEVTSAYFEIEHGHKTTIRFSPALSGRFILLNLSSNRHRGVDVQSVIAVGYGGPRFFPAGEYA